MLKWMIAEGYGDARTLERRVARMEEWVANPVLMEADPDADYAATIDINLNEVSERSEASFEEDENKSHNLTNLIPLNYNYNRFAHSLPSPCSIENAPRFARCSSLSLLCVAPTIPTMPRSSATSWARRLTRCSSDRA